MKTRHPAAPNGAGLWRQKEVMILIVYTLVIISVILFSVAFWYALFLVLAPRRKTGPNYSAYVNNLLKLPCDYEK